MRLRISLQDNATQATRNLVVTADATATVGDIARVLSAGPSGDVKAPENTLSVVEYSGRRTVPSHLSLLHSGLRSGQTLELVKELVTGTGRRSGEAAALVRVVEGPDRGVEVQIPIGVSSVGRAADCDVRLSDPTVSKVHAQISVTDRLEVRDNNSANGVVVGGAQVSSVVLQPGDHVSLGETTLSITPLRTVSPSMSMSTDVPFVRSPRVVTRPRSQEFEIPDIPAAPRHQPLPVIAMIAPLVMGAVLFAFTRSALSLVFVTLSPLMMLGNYLSQRNQVKKQAASELSSFEASMDQLTQRVDLAREQERAQLLTMYPSAAEVVQAMVDAGPLLWTRRPEHLEFLHIRLGLGTVAPLVRVKDVRTQGRPELVDRALTFRADRQTLDRSPVVANLRSVGGVGVCGESTMAEGVARAFVAQLVGLHSPAEVVVAALLSSRSEPRWTWLQWLPHSESPHSPLPGAQLCADAAAGSALLTALEALVNQRCGDDEAARRGPLDGEFVQDPPVTPSVVVIVDDTVVDRGRLTRLVERGPDAGVFFLWVAPSREDLPAACRVFAEVAAGTNPTASMVREEIDSAVVIPETIDESTAEEVARLLAPAVDVGAPVDDDSNLPRAVPVVSLIGHEAADDADVVIGRWQENQSLLQRDLPARPLAESMSSLRAVVGHSGSEPFTLDLRTQGPHALVGGTTGAGKSEFLQAWVLGLAHTYSPDKVTFLFVDYKGGSAFARCTDLPHCVGLVTDLSPYLVRRALRSLRAELHYRERLLNKKGKKDLLELEQTGDPECPPSLIIVVDEFAALVGEVPEFVDGVVDVAQRGRSLGLHLILATQRPAGVIKDNLRANTNLRIALRMADEHDSVDVIGDMTAAHISPSIPGRGVAKTGPGRLTPFQSAFPGSRTSVEPAAPPITVEEFGFSSRQAWAGPPVVGSAVPVAKDIDRIVDTLAEAARRARVPMPRKPWQEGLAVAYDLTVLGVQRTDEALLIGIRDDPDHQAQPADFFFPDKQGNILYLGAGGAGKSTALRSLAIAASITPKGGPVNLYGLDFAGGGLTPLEPLANLGSVVPGDDDERVQRLLRMMRDLIDERAARYSAVRASDLTEYRKNAPAPQEPRILLLVDGFPSFRSEYEAIAGRDPYYQMFSRILADGRAVGVHVAMTADRPSAVPVSVSSSFQKRIVLRQADEDSYYTAGLPRDVLTPASPPGRGMEGDSGQELQIAILGKSLNVAVQSRTIDEFARATRPRVLTAPAPIEALPTTVPAGDFPRVMGGNPVIGVRDDDLRPFAADIRGAVLVAGPAQSGRTNAVNWLAQAVSAANPGARLVHMSGRPSPLAHLRLWRSSTMGADDVMLEASELLAQAQMPAADGPGLCVLIESMPDFLGTGAENPLLELVKAIRRNGHVVVAEGETSSWNTWPLLAEIRNASTGLLLAPDQSDGELLLKTPLPRIKRADFPPGRGFWVRGGKAVKVQVPLVE